MCPQVPTPSQHSSPRQSQAHVKWELRALDAGGLAQLPPEDQPWKPRRQTRRRPRHAPT